MTLANPLLLVRDIVKRRNATLTIKNGDVHFPLRPGMGIGCTLSKPSHTLAFRIAVMGFPMPRGNRGEVIRFFKSLNSALFDRGHFHANREGKFSLHPKGRIPVYRAYLPNARRRTQQEVDQFFELMVDQFDEVLPLFVAAHAYKQVPDKSWIDLALSKKSLYPN